MGDVRGRPLVGLWRMGCHSECRVLLVSTAVTGPMMALKGRLDARKKPYQMGIGSLNVLIERCIWRPGFLV